MSEGVERDSRRQYSVPIGGAGAGSIEPGPDGRFRDISINNNRGPGEAIKLSAASFMALRVAQPGGEYVRILQSETREPERFPDLGAKRLEKSHLVWRGLYPRVDYAVKDPECPIQAIWSVFSPIIPFDHEASVLPICCMGLRCSNPSDEALDVSIVLNWENLCGHTAARTPDRIARVMPTRIEHDEKYTSSQTPDRKTGRIGTFVGEDGEEVGDSPETDTPEPKSRYNAIIFGGERNPDHNADSMQCVAARIEEDISYSVLAWDHNDPEDRSRFWEEFGGNGEFFRADSNEDAPRSGAVCARLQLDPGETRRVDFVITWYAPRYVVDDKNLGIGYTNKYKNAVDVARNGLQFVDYYSTSVDDWHRRLRTSTLPKWLGKMLTNSAHIYTTNACYTKNGRFTLRTSSATDDMVEASERLYTSLAVLLWYPRFEETTLTHLAEFAEDNAGRLLVRARSEESVTGPDILATAAFALSCYRNYRATGNLARIQNLMPALRKSMGLILNADANRDGLPETSTPWHTYDGIEVSGICSYSSSLWIAALHAYARLARAMRKAGEADQFESRARQATARFEQLLWDESSGYYRLFTDPKVGAEEQPKNGRVCHTGQLAGQWYADFLGLGSLFDRSRIIRALETMEEYNERTYGIASAMMPDGRNPANPEGSAHEAEGHYAWPGFTNAHYSCLQIHRGQVQRALRSLEKFFRNTQYKHSQQYDQPQKWDLVNNHTVPDSLERHAGALSIWYVLYAMQGLSLDVPDQRLRVMPNLPKGMHSVQTPMFTPSCLGWLKYQEDTLNGYRQRLHVSFDSPVSLRSIELRIPANTGELGVLCEIPDGRLPVTFDLRPLENMRLLTLKPERPIIASSALSVHVFTHKT